MAYTIGTSHGPFTGRGSFAVNKPAGLRTVLTGIPSWAARDTSLPTRYFRIGRYTLGNTHGFQNSVPLEYAQQVAYPLPPDWDVLAYDIRDGASCVFYELVAVPDLTTKAPWDRTPLQVARGGIAGVNGATALTTTFTYTVPVGRRLVVASARVQIHRLVAASVGGATTYAVVAPDGTLCSVTNQTNIVGAIMADDFNGSGLILNPGQTIYGTVASTDSGGNQQGICRFSGYLFDA